MGPERRDSPYERRLEVSDGRLIRWPSTAPGRISSGDALHNAARHSTSALEPAVYRLQPVRRDSVCMDDFDGFVDFRLQ